MSSIPGLGRSSEEGNGNPLQWTEEPGGLWSMGSQKSQTRLSDLQQLLFVYRMTHASGRHSVCSTGWHNFFQTSALLLQQALSTTLNCSIPKHFLSFPTSVFPLSVLPLSKHFSCIFHSPVLSEPYTQYGAHRSCPMETACFHAGLTHSCLISFIFWKLLKASKISIKSIIPRHNSLYIIHNK